MSTIFVSYRRGDSAGHAGRLVDRLRTAFPQSRVFMDVDTIQPGVDVPSIIEEAIASCDVVVFLIGEDWLAITDRHGHRRLDDPNDFVRLELAAALRRKVPLIPVLVQQASMPTAAQLPVDLTPLTRINALEVSDLRWDYDIGRLIATLKSVVEEPIGKRPVPAPPPGPVPDRPTPGWRPKRAIVPVAAVAAVAVVAVLALLIGGGSGPRQISSDASATTVPPTPTTTPAPTTTAHPTTTGAPTSTTTIYDKPPVLRSAAADRSAGTVTLTFDQPVNLGPGPLAPLQLVIYGADSACSRPAGNGQEVVSGLGTRTLVLYATSLAQPTTHFTLAHGFAVSVNSRTPSTPVGCRPVTTS